MKTFTLKELNTALKVERDNIKTAQAYQVKAIRNIIKLIGTKAKDNKADFISNKAAKAFFLNELDGLKSDQIDPNTKKAIRIAKAIILDGYSLKIDSLSASQMSQLITINKNKVNKLYKENLSDYVEAVKTLISEYKVVKSVKVFSAKKAKGDI